MSLQIIGAGVGRTGTLSLRQALEHLLGGRCYHMLEVFPRPQDIPVWHAAAGGKMPDWQTFFGDYTAAVDWPASAFWPELHAAFPAAKIVLSVRDAESWWRSASNTIFPAMAVEHNDWRRMIDALFERRFVTTIDDKDACITAYEAHNARVRASVPATHLVEWRPQDGWGPICTALDLPIPDDPFPHVNSTAEFHERRADRKKRSADGT